MAKTAGEILTDAATVLQDSEHVRWPLPELGRWLNDAQRAIVQAKPSANSEIVVLELVSGTLQSLGDEERLLLLRLPRNVTGDAAPYTGARAIRPTTRETLDASEPNWHSPDYRCFHAEVRQYVYDEESPREFWVYPGNDGTGKVEAVVSVLPDMITATATAIGAYNSQSIGLPEPYAPVILDYILYRAFSKDDPAAETTRAQLHYRAFATALGLKVQAERATSPNTRAGVVRT